MEKKDERILIGKVTTAFGIRGEVKVYSYAGDPSRFRTLKQVFVGGVPMEIESVREKAPLVLLKFAQVKDRNEAEKLRGAGVEMLASDLPELPEGEFYIRDLLGLPVQDEDGRELGVLKDVLTDRPQDLFVVQTKSKKELLIPVVPEFVLSMDPAVGHITVHLIEGMEEA